MVIAAACTTFMILIRIIDTEWAAGIIPKVTKLFTTRKRQAFLAAYREANPGQWQNWKANPWNHWPYNLAFMCALIVLFELPNWLWGWH